MKQHPDVTYVEIGALGNAPVRIPIISFGNGHPIITILCGVHGDETAGFMAVRRLLKRLSLFVGTVRLVTVANPVALLTHTRVAFADFYDLNRVGKGKPDGTLTERIAHNVCRELEGSDLIIDLHEFVMDTPPMAIYIPCGVSSVDTTALRAIAAFEPTYVWAMDL